MPNEEIENVDYNSPEWKELAEYERQQELMPPTPNNPPWNSWIAFGTWIFSILMITLVPAVFVMPYAMQKGISFSDNNGLTEFLKNDTTAILIQIISVFPAHIFTLILCWFVVTGFKRYPFFETLGWSNGNFRWYYYPLIIVGFFTVAGVVSHFLPEQDNEMLRLLRSSYTTTLVVAFLATFTAPLVEEVIYRGVMYSAFQRTFGVSGGVVLVTFFFALVHVPQYWGSPGTILMICLLSLILTLIRVKTDSLLPCVILHTIFNGLQSIILVLEPYLPKAITEPEQKAAAIFKLFS